MKPKKCVGPDRKPPKPCGKRAVGTSSRAPGQWFCDPHLKQVQRGGPMALRPLLGAHGAGRRTATMLDAVTPRRLAQLEERRQRLGYGSLYALGVDLLERGELPEESAEYAGLRD